MPRGLVWRLRDHLPKEFAIKAMVWGIIIKEFHSPGG